MHDEPTTEADPRVYKLAKIALELVEVTGEGHIEALLLALRAWEEQAVPEQIADGVGLALVSCHKGLIPPEQATATILEMFTKHPAKDAAA